MSSITPTPNNIRKKIKEGVYKLIDYSSKRKSDVWKSFGVIFTDENEQINGYVACKECQKVMVYDSHKTGTSSLRKHCCTLSLPRRATINNFFPRKNFRAPTTQDKEKITRLAVKYVCKDIRSFETINGDGFYELAQGLVDIGACVGRVDVRTLLPDPTTVSRNTNKYADEVRQSLISELKDNLGKHGQGALTLDMWTDDYRKISYLCITVHYINSDWALQDRVLCTSEWDPTLRKTADNIKPTIIQALRKFSLDDLFSKLVYVTDRGANIVAALRTVTRLNCTAHLLNTVLQNTLGRQLSADESGFGHEVLSVINAAKALVTFFKHSNLQSRLKKTLKASVETRWNSLHTMLDSIYSQYDDIRTVLEERNEEHRLNDLPLDSLSSLVNLLQKFKEATVALEASKTPTLHLTVVWFERIKRHLQPSSTDSYTLTSLKKKCLTNLQLKFHVHMLHKIAVFLHPKLKSLKLINNDEDITNVLNEVRRLVAEIQDRVEEDREVQLIMENCNVPSATAAGPVSVTVAPSRKKKNSSQDLSDVEDSSGDDACTQPDEVQLYCDLKISNSKSSSSSSKSEDFNLLHWWKEHSPVFPYLAQLARFVLSIPSTSTPSERDFSTAGFVLQERRTQLKPGTVDDILFLHSNLPKKTESVTTEFV